MQSVLLDFRFRTKSLEDVKKELQSIQQAQDQTSRSKAIKESDKGKKLTKD